MKFTNTSETKPQVAQYNEINVANLVMDISTSSNEVTSYVAQTRKCPNGHGGNSKSKN